MTALALNKPSVMAKFMALAKRSLPWMMTSREADVYRLGLQYGYGEGLKDGVNLGVEASGMSISTAAGDMS